MDLTCQLFDGADVGLNGYEGATSLWGSLPHGLYGAVAAGPCVRTRIKKRAPSKPRKQEPRRYDAASPEELARALQPSPTANAWPQCPVPTLRPGSKAEARRAVAPTKRAALLDDRHIERVLSHIEAHSRSPESDRVKMLLSCKAGLRAGEIAGLTIRDCVDVEGKVDKSLFVSSAISKSRKSRSVPVHPELRAALEMLMARYPDATHVAFSRGRNGRRRQQSAAAVTHWFCQLYKKVGLHGCSSHSGRRTFATHLARRLQFNRSSLIDLKTLLGHAHISSTECYLEPSPELEALIDAL